MVPPPPHKPELGQCWVWARCTDNGGYGLICESAPSQKMVGAHRVAWELHNGPIPANLQVRHNCDNPSCVNPAHLLCGTGQDNMDDKVKRGRQTKGEGIAQHKLTEEQIDEIRRDYVYGSRTHGQPALARKYWVGHTTIGLIVRGKTWK